MILLLFGGAALSWQGRSVKDRTGDGRDEEGKNSRYGFQQRQLARVDHLKVAVELAGIGIDAVLTHGIAEDAAGIPELFLHREGGVVLDREDGIFDFRHQMEPPL